MYLLTFCGSFAPSKYVLYYIGSIVVLVIRLHTLNTYIHTYPSWMIHLRISLAMSFLKTKAVSTQWPMWRSILCGCHVIFVAEEMKEKIGEFFVQDRRLSTKKKPESEFVATNEPMKRSTTRLAIHQRTNTVATQTVSWISWKKCPHLLSRSIWAQNLSFSVQRTTAP
jgi:hypothetical protein